MFKGVHHIAYLVENLDAAADIFVNVLGATALERKYFEPSGVEVALVRLGNVLFELVLPVREGTVSHEHLRRHGPGFYHIGLEVDDITEALAKLREAGVGAVDQSAVPGVNWDVAWLQTDSMLGVPSQLVQPKGAPSEARMEARPNGARQASGGSAVGTGGGAA